MLMSLTFLKGRLNGFGEIPTVARVVDDVKRCEENPNRLAVVVEAVILLHLHNPICNLRVYAEGCVDYPVAQCHQNLIKHLII